VIYFYEFTGKKRSAEEEAGAAINSVSRGINAT
jgi:hypothetical protein